MRFDHAGYAKRFLGTVFAVATLAAANAASAQVTWSIGVETPRYYEPAPVYQAPPPVYYQPVQPGYYGPPPGYYRPPPPPTYYRPAPVYDEPGDWRGARGYEQPRLSDMQQRALNNCSMLAWRDQSRCRATVMSTVR